MDFELEGIMLSGVENGLNLPALRSNPFSTQPLGKDEMELLVGREEQLKMLTSYVRFASPRVVGVVGEKGSGRTSLMNVVTTTSEQVHTVFWPSGDEVTTILHQMYCDLLNDFDTPPVHSVLINRLEADLAGRTGLLPVIVFDHPHLPGNELADVLIQLMPVLTSIRALTLISLTPGQKSGFPEELLAEMDITSPLEPLNRHHLSQLVSRRVSKKSRSTWSAPDALLDMVLESTGGHAGRAVRLLRDVVDASRGMPLPDGREINLSIFVSETPKSDVHDATFKRVADEAKPVNRVEVRLNPQQPASQPDSNEGNGGGAHGEVPPTDGFSQVRDKPLEVGPTTPDHEKETPYSQGEDPHRRVAEQPLDTPNDGGGMGAPKADVAPEEGYDEGIEFDPTQFPTLSDSEEMWNEGLPDVESGSSFEGDAADELDSAASDRDDSSPETMDLESSAETDTPQMVEPPSAPPRRAEPITAEAWRSELRDEQGGAEIIEMESGTAPSFGGGRFGGLRSRNKAAKMQIGARANAGAPKTSGPMEAKPNRQDEDGSPHHQVDFNDGYTMLWIQDGVDSPLTTSPPAPSGDAASNPTPMPSPALSPPSDGGVNPSKMDGMEAATTTDVISALSNLRRQESPRTDDSLLNVDRLMNLSEAEIHILEQATQREVSPSDEYLQKTLSVGRPRLSQLFNRLLEDGIMVVRKEGRSRLYKISRPAAQHLISTDGGGDV